MKKVGVILSGCGVYDGSEIHESVFTLLAIDELGAKAVCFAPDANQHHVVNHLNGEEMKEQRNMLVEAARIARGDIRPLSEFNASELDALVIPGGFGAAKNLTKWAFSGPDGEIRGDVENAIRSMVESQKPVCGLCMGPTVIAKALEGTEIHATLTVGTTQQKSPYEIGAISQGMEKAGAKPVMKSVHEIAVDETYKIVSAPCYMMEARISEVRNNIFQAIDATLQLA
jgi:enhancing lycopene biosynthesis protein 2